jgi:hypothetical protein
MNNFVVLKKDAKSNSVFDIAKPRLIAFYLPQYHPIPENGEEGHGDIP